MQISESGSGYCCKGTVLARSTVVLITEPQKRKMLYSVAIDLLLFFLNSCSNWNTQKQKDTSSISEDYWGPRVGKSRRDLQVSRLLSCPSGSAASQLRGNFTKYMNICPATHKKTLSTFKWEQTGKHTLAHRHTQAHTSQISCRCAIAKYLLNASPVWVGSFPSSCLGPRKPNSSEINRAAAVLFLLSLHRAEHSGRTLGSQLASPTQPSCS